MKIVKKSLLHYQKGSSNKVYNVYLKEVDGVFLVDFEYGRYGANLRKGTKTKTAVDFSKAQKLFDSVVVSKINKGYTLKEGFDSKKGEEKKSRDKISKEQYQEWLINILQKAYESSSTTIDNYKLSKLIFKAGEIYLKSSRELILKIYQANFEQSQTFFYSVAFTIGRIGEKEDIKILEKISKKLPYESQYIIDEAINMLSKEKDDLSEIERVAKKALKEIEDRLSQADKKLIQESIDEITKNTNNQIYERVKLGIENLEEFKKNYQFELSISHNSNSWWWTYASKSEKKEVENIKNHFNKERKKISQTIINFLYKKESREYLKKIIDILATKDKKLLVKIFKVAYFREDFEILAKINSHFFADRAMKNGYFKRRDLRLLKQLAMFEPTKYISYSTEILLTLNDFVKDFMEFKKVWFSYDYDTWESIKRHLDFDAFAFQTSAFYIMRGNSKAHTLTKDKKAWIKSAKSTQTIQDTPHSKLWQENLEIVLEILTKSQVEMVQKFAINIIKENPNFLRNIGIDKLIPMLNLIDKEARDVFSNILKDIYLQTKNQNILKAFILNSNEDIFSFGLEQLGQNRDLLKDEEFFIQILKNSSDRVFEESLKTLKELDGLDSLADFTLKTLLNEELPLKLNSKDRFLISLKSLIKYLKSSQIEVTLLNQKELNDFVLIGLKLVREGSFDISFETKEKIAFFNHPEVRATMIFLLGKLEDKILSKESKLLVSFIYDKDKKVRAEAKKLLKRLSKNYSKEILNHLSQFAFLSSDEEVQKDVLITFHYLKKAFKDFSPDITYRLITAKSRLANIIGTEILKFKKPEDFSIAQWVKFAKALNYYSRRWAFEAFEKNRDKIRQSLPKPLEIFDTSWEDTREFAKRYFRDFDLDLDEVLIVADSIYYDVQSFAKELIKSKNFDKNRLALTLSQHPAQNIQQFVISEILLDISKDELIKLSNFFSTIFISVNKNRVAKSMILELLNSKIEDRDIAKLYCELATKFYPTMVKRDRADFIEAMYKIKKLHSDIELPLKIIDDLEVKSAI